jgi:transposase-like protein
LGSQPSYAVSTKEMAVLRVEAGEKVSVVASEIGVRPGRLYYWLDRWREHGGEWPEQRRRRRRKRMAAPGSTEREGELERLLGQKQLELDFFEQALRVIEEARRPLTGRSAPSSMGTSRPGRLVRKAP